MVKILLMISVFCICSILGFAIGESYKKRLNELKEFKKAIIFLQNEVLYNNTPIIEAFLIIKTKVEDPISSLFEEVASEMSNSLNEKNAKDIFMEYYKKEEDMFNFRHNDIKTLEDFFRSVGDTGIYGQEKIFNLAIENIKMNIEEAKDSESKNTKLFRELGVCFGAMIAILII